MSLDAVIALAGAILALLAAILVPIGILIRRRTRRADEQVIADTSGDPAIRGPEHALYRGGSGPYPTVNGNGRLVLTRQRLIFRILIGTDVVVALNDVIGIREARSFQHSVQLGKTHLVVQTAAGEFAFFVNDNAAWVAAIKSAAPNVLTPSRHSPAGEPTVRRT